MASRKIGRYIIESELGRGGMSTVFLAHDPPMDRQVAVKLLPREFLHAGTFRERFNREARIIASLEHPAIVPIYDFGEDAGQPYFVLRYMSGGSLAERLKRGPLSIDETVDILERIGSALDYAHNRGIIHRDLKPANILFDHFGTAYLGDFGIARLQETGATLTGTVYLGTPAYMSPEQVQSDTELDGRADIYALGVILFEVLTGQRPFHATTPAGLALKHVTEPVPSVTDTKPELPPDVDRVITRAMAKDRDDRYPSAVELTAAVNQLATGKTVALSQTPVVPVPPPTVLPPVSPPAEKRRVLPFAIGGITILIILCLGALVAGFFIARSSGVIPFFSTSTATPASTSTSTPSPAATLTATATETATGTATSTPTGTVTPSRTPTLTATPTEAAAEPTLRPTFTSVPTDTPPPPTSTRPPATATSPPPATATSPPPPPTSTSPPPPTAPRPTDPPPPTPP